MNKPLLLGKVLIYHCSELVIEIYDEIMTEKYDTVIGVRVNIS